MRLSLVFTGNLKADKGNPKQSVLKTQRCKLYDMRGKYYLLDTFIYLLYGYVANKKFK